MRDGALPQVARLGETLARSHAARCVQPEKLAPGAGRV